MTTIDQLNNKIRDAIQEEINDNGDLSMVVMETITIACIYDTTDGQYCYSVYLDTKQPPHHHVSLMERGSDMLDDMLVVRYPDDDDND